MFREEVLESRFAKCDYTREDRFSLRYHVRNIENQLDRYIELQSQRWIYEIKTSITYESSSQW